jgi:hypothetical protein
MQFGIKIFQNTGKIIKRGVFFPFLETESCYVAQAGLEFLDSSNHPTLAPR